MDHLIKLIKEYGTRAAVIVMAVALLLFIPAGLTQSKALFAVLAILIFLFLGGAIALVVLAKKPHLGDVHYFLYHPETKRTMPRASLNEKLLRERVSLYVDAFGRTPLSLWDEIPKDMRGELSLEPQFKPVLAYGMLLALSDCKEAQINAIFQQADIRAVFYVSTALKEANDVPLAEYLYDLKKKGADASVVVPFFVKNAPRFSVRALNYIQRNFDEFYVEKSRFAK